MKNPHQPIFKLCLILIFISTLLPTTASAIKYDKSLLVAPPKTCSTPSQEPSNHTGVSINANDANFSVSRGDGDNFLVLAKQGSPVNASPTNDVSYFDRTDFGTGDQLGSENYAIWAGSGSNFAISALESGTTYYIRIFEYNKQGNKFCYNQTYYEFSFTTPCSNPTTISSNGTSNILSDSTAAISWTSGDGANKLVVLRPLGAAIEAPTQNQAYTENTTYGNGEALGGGYVISNGTENSLTITGLMHSSTYSVDIYDYNEKAPDYCYNTTPYTFNISTPKPDVFTWNKESGSHSFTDPSNWTPTRLSPADTDTLLFSNGGQTTITDFPADTVTYVKISNGTVVNILNNSTASNFYIKVNGSFVIDDGCQLNISGSNAIAIHIAIGANMQVSGSVSFDGATNHCFLGQLGSAIQFLSGSSFTCHPNYIGNPFGNASENSNSVIFRSGSSFHHEASSMQNIFGRATPNTVLNFETGSRYYHKSSAIVEAPGRFYGTFVYDYNGEVSLSNGNQDFTVDTLIVQKGKLAFKGNQKVNVRGRMEIAGGDSLIFDPTTDLDVEFNGAVSQMANQGGGIRFGKKSRLVLKTGNDVTLSGNVLIEGNLLNESSATLNIGPGDSIRIGGVLENAGDIYLSDDASLIQEDSSTTNNTGVFHISRNIPDGASSSAYHFWSSPVDGGDGGKIGSGGVLTGSAMYKYAMGGSSGSAYQWVGNGEEMEAGRGYAVSGTSGATFYGTPNNGTISINIHKNAGESYNVIGNPYPSAVNGQEFMDENNTVIDGTVYMWSFDTHDNSGDKQYIAVNQMGSTSIIDLDQDLSTTNIASCQGIFVKSHTDLAEGDATLVFKNKMRNGYNSAFKARTRFNFHEKNWVYVTNQSHDTTAFLYAIVDEATDKFDNHMDAESFSSGFRIGVETAHSEQSILAAPPLDGPVQYPLTINVTESGMHNIGLITRIYDRESEFQPVLIDTETSQTIELDEESHTVYLDKGLYVGRFYLLFTRAKSPGNGGGSGTTTSIGKTDMDNSLNKLSHGVFKLQTLNSNQNRVDILDSSGKLIRTEHLSGHSSIINISSLPQGIYIIRLIDQNSKASTFRIAHN